LEHAAIRRFFLTPNIDVKKKRQGAWQQNRGEAKFEPAILFWINLNTMGISFSFPCLGFYATRCAISRLALPATATRIVFHK
jgi:hypothetical protein